MKVKIEKFDHLGNGIAKNEDKIVFVKKALPNEIIDVSIKKEKKHYNVGTINEIIEPSKNRIKSICPYYDKCGGCNFLHAHYDVEKDFKINKGHELISNNLSFCDTKEYNYRNKVVFHIKDNKIGFYQQGSNKIVDIDYCYLLDDRINKVLKTIKLYLKDNSITKIMVRVGNDIMLDIVGNVNKELITNLNFVDTIVLNDKVIKGKGYVEKKLFNYKFKISPKSFFQVNYDGLTCIYNILKKELIKEYNYALDLYSGTSVMGILISEFCKKVISVECNSDATNDALINIKNNDIDNIEVINDKVENIIDNLCNVDLIIVDPPRSGLDVKTINYIKSILPDTLVYISCDMITLKRDLEVLKDTFNINNTYLINMFSKTYHVENLCILTKK